jgi:circadian clock protein KaiC
MTTRHVHASAPPRTIDKAPTGIHGFDDLTLGGLPRGRPTLVCGGAGCGKTLFAAEFLARGARQFGEPGVFLAFEENAADLRANVASLGFDFAALQHEKLLVVDHVRVERSQIEETGEYDLEGLFIRLGHAIDSIGARRVVLDTLETLFGGLGNETIVRAELRRLFQWLKDRGMTAVITAERGDGALTRHGLEEYVSDCVVLLDHRLHDQVSTRRLRVVKYRGSAHGTNEYPFLIDDTGISVLPVTTTLLDHHVSNERVATGVPGLDAMLGGQGYYAGSAILVSGTSGTGKSSVAAHFVDATCRSGKRCLYFAFEESPHQIVRNMRSIGIDLERWLRAGSLAIHAARPATHGLEMHLVTMNKRVQASAADAVVIDPISNFLSVGTLNEVHAMLGRLFDLLKSRQITTLMTNLTTGGRPFEATDVGLSSLVDTWILLRDSESSGERTRALYVLKSRGMPHSNQIREFTIGPRGIELRSDHGGPDGGLTGASEAKADGVRREILRRQRALAKRRQALEAQVLALRAKLSAQEDALQSFIDDSQSSQSARERGRACLPNSRGNHGAVAEDERAPQEEGS